MSDAAEKLEYVEPTVIEVENSIDDEPEEQVLSDRDRIAKEYAQREEAKRNPEPVEEEFEEPEAIDEPEEPDEIEITVNGVHKMVERSKVEAAGGVEIYQKQLAANYGLQELAEQRKRFQQEVEEFERNKAQRLPQADSNNERNLPENSDDYKTMVSKYHEAVYDGDEDVANELFEQIIQSRAQSATQNVDYDEIAARAAQKTRAQIEYENRNREAREAREAFAENFPDVFNDKNLYSMAGERTVTLQQEHPDWTPAKVIQEAGREVQEWYSTLAGKNPDNREDKVAAKRKMKAVRSATGRAAPKPEPKQQTDSEYVTMLRKQRGLE